MPLNVHRSHPNYWVSVMTFSVIDLALGLNFAVLHPTFLIFGAPNWVWAVCFSVLAVGQVVCLNTGRLHWLRWLMSVAVVYFSALAAGATRPFLDGEGSLQLPILYIGLATLLVPLVAEPPANPLTMKEPRLPS